MNSSNTRIWVLLGAMHGAFWGVLAALVYTVWIPFLIIQQFFAHLPTHIIPWLMNTPAPVYTLKAYLVELQNINSFSYYLIGIGSFVGGIPALMIGAGSGAIIGGVLSQPTIAPNPKTRMIVGGVLGGILVLIVNTIGYIQFPDYRHPVMYGLAFGIPSVVYMIICISLSYRLAGLVEHERTHAKEALVQSAPSATI